MTQYMAYLYEVVEVIGEDTRPITAECRTEDQMIYMLIERAVFTLGVMGHAWAEAKLALMKKAYPDRDYTYRRIRLNHDPEPPMA